MKVPKLFSHNINCSSVELENDCCNFNYIDHKEYIDSEKIIKRIAPIPKKAPKGSFNDVRVVPVANNIIPNSVPNNEPIRSEAQHPNGPVYAPIIANKSISPSPSPLLPVVFELIRETIFSVMYPNNAPIILVVSDIEHIFNTHKKNAIGIVYTVTNCDISITRASVNSVIPIKETKSNSGML